MTFGSVCSGIEAASVAWHPLGWGAEWLSEIEPFPSAVLAHRYPTVPNLGDMTHLKEFIREGYYPAPDVFVGGTPCFTAGQLVLSERGYVPIETLRVGDKVVSHLGRLQPILAVGSKVAPIGKMSMVGRPEGIVSTTDHPFLASSWENKNTKREGKYCRVEKCTPPEWRKAKDMVGKQWCALSLTEIDTPSPKSRLFTDDQATYVAGMYLGDGWVRGWTDKKKKAVILGINAEKYKKLLVVIGDVTHTMSIERTGVRVTFHDTIFANWLVENFNTLSHNKTLPAWVLSAPNRDLLLQGYLDSDGCVSAKGITINTTSESLAYGVATLLETLEYVASVAKVETPPTCVIEGRTVNQRDYFQVKSNKASVSKKSRVRHGYLMRTVQAWEMVGEDTVYNIEVGEDNSYILNGAIVHNCQSFSVAGLRSGLDDPRGGLTLEFIRIADAIDESRDEPSIIVWENVPGVLSSKDNAFGAFLGGLCGEECELVPSGKKWTDAGCVYGPKRTVAWRVLDAQYFGVAQRRKRVFVIASARTDIDPSEILFEFDGLRRDTPPSREAGQSSTSRVGEGSAFSIIADTTPKIGEDVRLTMRSQGGGIVPPSVALTYPIHDKATRHGGERGVANGFGIGHPTDPCPTLDTAGNHAVAHVFKERGGCAGGGKGYLGNDDLTYTISCHQDQNVLSAMQVRRLTPVECERLQGFPDFYTDVPYRKKPAADGNRYKALGNSMAVPVMHWIGQRIQQAIDNLASK